MIGVVRIRNQENKDNTQKNNTYLNRFYLDVLMKQQSMCLSQNISITIVTEDQSQKAAAEKLADLLLTELGGSWEIISVEKYHKFDNSFKLELIRTFSGIKSEELNLLAIRIADSIASPWLVYFDKDENSIELIYNKDKNSLLRREEFNNIRWGQLQVLRPDRAE